MSKILAKIHGIIEAEVESLGSTVSRRPLILDETLQLCNYGRMCIQLEDSERSQPESFSHLSLESLEEECRRFLMGNDDKSLDS